VSIKALIGPIRHLDPVGEHNPSYRTYTPGEFLLTASAPHRSFKLALTLASLLGACLDTAPRDPCAAFESELAAERSLDRVLEFRVAQAEAFKLTASRGEPFETFC
jgi:hypothetical protein